MGCWRRQCRNKSATDCAGAPASAMLASYFYSKVSASSRRPSYPAPTSVLRSQSGPSRPRPRRESAHPQRRSLSGSGSLRSPSPCAAKARQHPTLPDRLRGHAPVAALLPRPWSLGDSLPAPAIPPHPSCRQRDSQQPRLTRNPRPSRIRITTDITRSNGRKRVYIYAPGSSGCRRCGRFELG